MATDGKILEQIQDRIEEMFDDPSLARCLKYKLNLDLHRIREHNFRDTVFALLMNADRDGFLSKMVEALGHCNPSFKDASLTLAPSLEKSAVPPRETAPAAVPGSFRGDVVLDISHNQKVWPIFSRALNRIQPSLFDLAESDSRSDLLGDMAPEIAPDTTIRLSESLLDDLPFASGVVVALPHGTSRNLTFIADETIDALESWVHEGGRLLMLSFELADAHHRTNLGALGSRFGIEFEMDLIAESADAGKDRPYDRAVEFGAECLNDHRLLRGVDRLKLVNACSVGCPGGTVVVRVGSNKLAKPIDPRFDGLWFMRPDVKYARESSPEAAVVVQASPDRTRRGAVVAVGTWDLFGCRDGRDPDDFRNNPGNRRFCLNLVSWLGGREVGKED